MSPAHVLEPTYRAIKSRLMEGAWRPGTRLEANRLADELGVSATPVRDSLNRLAGEAMIDFRAGDGFRVTRSSEQDLRDMIFVLVEVLLVCETRAPLPFGAVPPPAQDDDPAQRCARLFDVMAFATGNREIQRIVGSLNDRLHMVRRLEPAILTDWAQELAV